MKITLDQDAVDRVRSGLESLVETALDSLPPREAMHTIHQTVSHLMEQFMGDAPVACSSGCNFCCYQIVDVGAWELPVVVDAILTMAPGDKNRCVKAIRKRATEPVELRIARGTSRANKCPLLDREGRCSIYSARPLACRFYTSTSVEQCRRKAAGEDVNVDAASLPWLLKLLVDGAVRGGLTKRLGTEAGAAYELVSAVASELEKAGKL